MKHLLTAHHTDKKVRRHVTHRPLTACLAQQMDRLDLSRICRGNFSRLDGMHQRKSTVAAVLKGAEHAAFRALKAWDHDRRIILGGRQYLCLSYPQRYHRRKTAKQDHGCQAAGAKYGYNRLFAGKRPLCVMHHLAPFPSQKNISSQSSSVPFSAAHLLVSKYIQKLHTKVNFSPFAQNSPFR